MMNPTHSITSTCSWDLLIRTVDPTTKLHKPPHISMESNCTFEYCNAKFLWWQFMTEKQTTPLCERRLANAVPSFKLLVHITYKCQRSEFVQTSGSRMRPTGKIHRDILSLFLPCVDVLALRTFGVSVFSMSAEYTPPLHRSPCCYGVK